VPFDYYRRLSKKDQRTYDASDAIASVPLTRVGETREGAKALAEALMTGERRATNRAAQKLADIITADLGIETVVIKVLSRRPTSSTHELHGLYVREEGKPAIIRVWMRTAAHRAIVKPRTFTRTLLHEVNHHLDFVLFQLEESFHTEGFFRRESDLLRKVVGAGEKRGRGRKRERESESGGEKQDNDKKDRTKREKRGSPGTQLSLFGLK
jgi:hypothetical protein